MWHSTKFEKPNRYGKCKRTFCVRCARHHKSCDLYRPCKFFKIDSKLCQQKPKISKIFVDGSVQAVIAGKNNMRNRKYSSIAFERQIKILKLKMKHFNARMAFHKKKIKVKNDKIEAKKAENKKLKAAVHKMKQKYSKNKESWNNKRSKWKLKLKKMKDLISRAKEKQKNLQELIKREHQKIVAHKKQKRPHPTKPFIDRSKDRSTFRQHGYSFDNFKRPKENFQTTRPKDLASLQRHLSPRYSK